MVLDVFMALEVPEGSHSFEMRYSPAGLRPGLAVSAAALVLTLVFLLADGKRRKRTASEGRGSGGRAAAEEEALQEEALPEEVQEGGKNDPL